MKILASIGPQTFAADDLPVAKDSIRGTNGNSDKEAASPKFNKALAYFQLTGVGLLWVGLICSLIYFPPIGVLVLIPYVGMVILALSIPERWYLFTAAGIGTALTLVGFFVPALPSDLAAAIPNSIIVIFSIWISAVLCFLYKQKEESLETNNWELKESIKNLEAAQYRLKTANKHESQFLSSMSHELRTPLNAVIGFTDLLSGQYFGQLNEKQLSYVSQIDKSGKHLLDLINDLLDIAKIDAGATWLELEEFNPSECLLAVDLMRPQFKKKELEVHTFLDPAFDKMTADRRKFKQIMLNLLSNAYKYTPRNGKIIVRIVKEEKSAKIMVTDTGIGIDKADQDNIFKEFHQTNQARDEGLGGTGIGLSLTRRLVQIHGGEIGVKSDLGKGSTFWFTLPFKTLKKKAQKIAEEEAKVETEVTGLTGRRILVAEDSDVNLAVILDMLSVCGHIVIVARNGKEAIEMALANQPDLILMDIRMPVMDGLEATRRLRTLPQFKKLPIIALTASVGEVTRDKCMEVGCTEHLSKPIQSHILFRTLRHYLGSVVTK